VQDEGKNLNTLATELMTLVNCEVMGLASPYSGTCFGHILSKVSQHATNDEKVCKGMKKVSVKKAQGTLQKTIMWTKKSGKGRQEWVKACVEVGLPIQRLRTPVKTHFASRIVLFQVKVCPYLVYNFVLCMKYH
jgi:hypothetical protein